MKIIDAHFHLYKNAKTGILAQGGASLSGFTGAFEEAMPLIERAAVEKIVALAVIPIQPMRDSAISKWPLDLTPTEKADRKAALEEKLRSRLTDFNQWLLSMATTDQRIIPAIAVDPTLDSSFMKEYILSAIERNQVRILKIHPAVNRTSPTDKGYYPIYDLAQEKALPVICHGGFSGEDIEGKWCMPGHFKKVSQDFPTLKMVAAHLCYPHTEDLAPVMKACGNLYTDLSFVIGNGLYDDAALVYQIRSLGEDRVLYGSDYPWADPVKGAERLMGIGLTDGELERIAWKNASDLFGV